MAKMNPWKVAGIALGSVGVITAGIVVASKIIGKKKATKAKKQQEELDIEDWFDTLLCDDEPEMTKPVVSNGKTEPIECVCEHPNSACDKTSD